MQALKGLYFTVCLLAAVALAFVPDSGAQFMCPGNTKMVSFQQQSQSTQYYQQAQVQQQQKMQMQMQMQQQHMQNMQQMQMQQQMVKHQQTMQQSMSQTQKHFQQPVVQHQTVQKQQHFVEQQVHEVNKTATATHATALNFSKITPQLCETHTTGTHPGFVQPLHKIEQQHGQLIATHTEHLNLSAKMVQTQHHEHIATATHSVAKTIHETQTAVHKTENAVQHTAVANNTQMMAKKDFATKTAMQKTEKCVSQTNMAASWTPVVKKSSTGTSVLMVDQNCAQCHSHLLMLAKSGPPSMPPLMRQAQESTLPPLFAKQQPPLPQFLRPAVPPAPPLLAKQPAPLPLFFGKEAMPLPAPVALRPQPGFLPVALAPLVPKKMDLLQMAFAPPAPALLPTALMKMALTQDSVLPALVGKTDNKPFTPKMEPTLLSKQNPKMPAPPTPTATDEQLATAFLRSPAKAPADLQWNTLVEPVRKETATASEDGAVALAEDDMIHPASRKLPIALIQLPAVSPTAQKQTSTEELVAGDSDLQVPARRETVDLLTTLPAPVMPLASQGAAGGPTPVLQQPSMPSARKTDLGPG